MVLRGCSLAGVIRGVISRMNELLKFGWTWYPSVVIGFSIWTLLYVFAIRRGEAASVSTIAFHAGTLIGLVALVSPLDELGDEYLFSAHMVQHLLLMFGTAPLWLIGTPGWLVDRIIPKGLTKSVEWLASPNVRVCWRLSVCMFFWHIPSIYEMAQESETIHIFEHLTSIGAGLIGWWPVMGAELVPHFQSLNHPYECSICFCWQCPAQRSAAILTFSHTPLYVFI